MDKQVNIIRKNFSKVAPEYDKYAILQSEVADRLINQFNGASYNSVLDIGMGTARLTQRIADKYPKACVYGCDFAEGMVQQAHKKDGFYSFCADARYLPFKDGSFDFVISNLVYQWVDNLERAFLEVRRVLREKSEFIFSCFTNQTLKELLAAYSQISHKNIRLPSKDKILNSLQTARFKDIKIISYSIKKYYKDIFQIANWLKKIGANHIEKSSFIGKEAWQFMNDYYRRNFWDNGSVFATFEVLEVKTQK